MVGLATSGLDEGSREDVEEGESLLTRELVSEGNELVVRR
jgi:hypothetical protein